MSGNRRPLGGAFGFLNSVFDDPFFSQGFGGAFEAHFGGVERVPAPSSTAREIRIDGPEDDAQPTQNRSAGPVIHELPDHEEPGYLFLSSSQPDHVHEPEDESHHHKNGQVHTPATLTPLDASAPPPAADQRASAPAPDVVTQVGPQHHSQQPQQQQAQQQQQQQQPATVRAPKGIRVRAAADAAGNNAQEAAPKAAAAPAAEGGEEEEPGSPLLVHLQAGMLRGGDTPRQHHSHGAHGGAASLDWLGNDSLQEDVPPQEQQQLYISQHLPKEHHASQSQQLPTHHTSQQQQQRQYTSQALSQQQYHAQHPSQQQRQSPAAQKAPDLVVSTPTGQASAAVDISPAAAWAPGGGTQPATVAGSFPGGFAFDEARAPLAADDRGGRLRGSSTGGGGGILAAGGIKRQRKPSVRVGSSQAAANTAGAAAAPQPRPRRATAAAAAAESQATSSADAAEAAQPPLQQQQRQRRRPAKRRRDNSSLEEEEESAGGTASVSGGDPDWQPSRQGGSVPARQPPKKRRRSGKPF